MSMQQFLLVFRARFRVFCVALAATVVAATLASLLMPKSYKATVPLLVDAKDEQSINNPLRPLVLPQERLNYMQTQMDILNSRKVALKVVRDLRLMENPEAREALGRELGGDELTEDRLVEGLQKNLKVDTSQSNVIQASFSASDPRRAAAVANAFAKGYIDTMLELRVEPTREAAAWFNEQLKVLRANLQEAQVNLTKYQQAQGIVSADDRFDDETTRLGVLAEQVARRQAQAIFWNGREQMAQRHLDADEAPDRLPDVGGNAFVQRLRGDLLNGEAKLRELSTQYGANHPNYERQATENRSLRERLAGEMRRAAAGVGAAAQQSRQRDAELQKALVAQRTRVLNLKENRNEFTLLKRNVESAERAYDTAMQRFVVSQVDSRANQTNVTVLNPAAVPRLPTRPRIALNVALSVVIGAILGIGLVLLMELRDRRVRSAEDLAQLQRSVPMLAVLGDRSAFERLLGGPGSGMRALPSGG
jgi:chain length determinant protein EpsF